MARSYDSTDRCALKVLDTADIVREARSYDSTDRCALKVLDTADIVRDAIFHHLRRFASGRRFR